MRLGWIVTSVALLAFFALALWLSKGLALHDALGPGPGFFPVWLAGIGAVLSVLLVIETARGPADSPGESLIPERDALFRIVSVIVVLSAGAFVFDWLGWRITALGVSLLLLPALGARSLLAIIPFSLAASFGVFHVFYHWLKVPLPIGTFGI